VVDEVVETSAFRITAVDHDGFLRTPRHDATVPGNGAAISVTAEGLHRDAAVPGIYVVRQKVILSSNKEWPPNGITDPVNTLVGRNNEALSGNAEEPIFTADSAEGPIINAVWEDSEITNVNKPPANIAIEIIGVATRIALNSHIWASPDVNYDS
jgi:hypothetical protein